MMFDDTDRNFAVLAIVLMGVMVLASLISRRPGIGTVARGIAGWLAIFGVIIVAYSYRGEILTVGDRVARDLNLAPQQQTQGGTLVVPMDASGHFTVEAQVNGVEARFLVDSGATITAISPALAAAAGIELDNSLPAFVQTANGRVQVQRGRVATLDAGPILTRDLGIISAEPFADINVLGMNYLSSLASWRVEGDEMILTPKPADDAQ